MWKWGISWKCVKWSHSPKLIVLVPENHKKPPNLEFRKLSLPKISFQVDFWINGNVYSFTSMPRFFPKLHNWARIDNFGPQTLKKQLIIDFKKCFVTFQTKSWNFKCFVYLRVNASHHYYLMLTTRFFPKLHNWACIDKYWSQTSKNNISWFNLWAGGQKITFQANSWNIKLF